MIPTREELLKAKDFIEDRLEIIHELEIANGYNDFPEEEKSLQAALACIQALLDAGEVMPPKKDLDNRCHCCHNQPVGCSECQYEGYNARADEDIAIVAKKMAGLEEVIEIALRVREVGVYHASQPEKYREEISKEIALAITESLKRER